MTAPREFDPRTTSIPHLEQLELTLVNQALPCGKIACQPFAEGCIQSAEMTPDPEIAALACGWLMATDVLAKEVEVRRSEAEEQRLEAEMARRLADKLSVDRELNILTFNSLKMLYELMEQSGLLTRLYQKGYTADMTFLDLDWLGGHNELGEHEGGDKALQEVVNAVRPLFRRRADFMGIYAYRSEAEENALSDDSFSQVGRYERGDEIVAISFNSPRRNEDDPRHSPEGLEARRVQILQALDPLVARYPLAHKRSLESIQEELTKKHCELKYEVIDGIVHAPVSAAFAIVRDQVPRTLAEFETLARAADISMHGKKIRRTGKSRGATVNYLAAQDL